MPPPPLTFRGTNMPTGASFTSDAVDIEVDARLGDAGGDAIPVLLQVHLAAEGNPPAIVIGEDPRDADR